jgi:Na+-driven multidrug efflux pump
VFQPLILNTLTRSAEVRAAAAAVMPVVIATQVFKGLGYATGGIILGGLDWTWSSLGSQLSAVLCLALVRLLPASLWNIWISLAVLMATQVWPRLHCLRYYSCFLFDQRTHMRPLQVAVAVFRFTSNRGPWHGLNLWSPRQKHEAEGK